MVIKWTQSSFLRCFTPHAKPELDQLDFTTEVMAGETLNVSFDSFKPIDPDLTHTCALSEMGFLKDIRIRVVCSTP